MESDCEYAEYIDGVVECNHPLSSNFGYCDKDKCPKLPIKGRI